MSIILASAVKGIPHIAAFDQTAEQMLSEMDLTKLLVYMYDTAPVEILDLLASQLDMLGYNGWILATTEQEKRNLLKGAIALKRIVGTPGGIKEVLTRLGFVNTEIIEGWQTEWGSEPVENPWAYFRVTYNLSNSRPLNSDEMLKFEGLINAYKNVRSILQGIGIGVDVGDNSYSWIDGLELNIINV